MMRFYGYFVSLSRIFVVAAAITIGIILSSCSQAQKLPTDVHDELTDYWQSLPSASSIEHEIIRAWPGETSNISGPLEWEMEIWCVESEIASAKDINLIGEEMVWIVVRDNEEEDWSAYLLGTFSSLWPYEACQVGEFLK